MKVRAIILLASFVMLTSLAACSKKAPDAPAADTAAGAAEYQISDENALEQADKVLKDIDSL